MADSRWNAGRHPGAVRSRDAASTGSSSQSFSAGRHGIPGVCSRLASGWICGPILGPTGGAGLDSSGGRGHLRYREIARQYGFPGSGSTSISATLPVAEVPFRACRPFFGGFMDPRTQSVFTRGSTATTVASAESQNRVLRNTYWLLALSMLPTMLGAWTGMQLNFFALFAGSPIMAPLLMFGVMIGALFGVTALRNSAWGVPALFGFTFIAGLMLAPILTVALGFRNGGQLVGLAGGMTAAIFFAMAGIATVSKRDFSFLGKFLFVGLVILIVASLANLFFQVPALSLTISAVAVLIFSMYLLHDVSNIVRGGETNYITATLNLFLDLFNIFISLLNILLVFAGQRD
jgi:modulator of FtsH protease